MQSHTSVLLQEAVEGLALKDGDTVVDATSGLGGHTELLAQVVGKDGTVVAIDADRGAQTNARARLAESPATIHFVLGNFRSLADHLESLSIQTIDGALFDLGWNSTQLESGRGFSFKASDPLVMTYDATPGSDTLTASTIVNTWSERDIADILLNLGEERFAHRIARAVVSAREREPILRTDQLAQVVQGAVPPFYRSGKIHPATKTFQALRMMVNDELTSITEGVGAAFAALCGGGRIAVITFHSLEDGLVKRLFRSLGDEGRATLITKKPLLPKREEIIKNPRARSAKLRIIQKL